MTTPPRPLPDPDVHTAAFWEACRREVLEVAACDECEHLFLPPAPCCPRCWSPRLGRRELSGAGRVFSFAVYRRTYHPALPAPYVVALIELDEGPRLLSNVVDCAPEEVFIGMPVTVRFDEVGDTTLPLFRPASGPAGSPHRGL